MWHQQKSPSFLAVSMPCFWHETESEFESTSTWYPCLSWSDGEPLKAVSLTRYFCKNRAMISAEDFRHYHHNNTIHYVLPSVWGFPPPHSPSNIAKIAKVFCPGEVLSCHPKVEENVNILPLPPQASGATASRLNVLTCLLQEEIPVRNMFLLVPGG